VPLVASVGEVSAELVIPYPPGIPVLAPDDVAFCRFLTSEIGVAAVPPSAFYADPARAPLLARFCFAKREETLRAAGERLGRLRQGKTGPGPD
jgi:aspartate/methionine/tyrosine aminotransferase